MKPRLLLVDDDAMLRRFVAMALEDLEIELQECETVAAALQSLAETEFALIITDLMMPGESGVGLLQRLQQSPALRGQARVVVMSAGLTPQKRETLEPYEIWRLLSKPVSVTELVSTVQSALRPLKLLAASVSANATETLSVAEQANVQVAIDEYFAGDASLFRSYHTSCLAQFPQDIAEADLASAGPDLGVLRRIAHNIKSVTRMLGCPDISELAHTLEQNCEAGSKAQALSGWQELRMRLQELCAAAQKHTH